jgi:hypothetical protein
VRQTGGARAADDDRHARLVAGDARVGADEEVVHDRRVVDRVREVQLGAAFSVDAEPVALHGQPPTGEELHEVLVPAPVLAHAPARERALEAVAPDRQAGTEASVYEVAAAAVVEVAVLDPDVVRPAPQQHAVDELRRPVAAMREVAVPDRHGARVGDTDERPEAGAPRRDDEGVEDDVPRPPDVHDRITSDRLELDVRERDAGRAVEDHPPHPGPALPDDPQRPSRPPADHELRVEPRPEDDRAAAWAERAHGRIELGRTPDGDPVRLRRGRARGSGRGHERRAEREGRGEDGEPRRRRRPDHRPDPSAGAEQYGHP